MICWIRPESTCPYSQGVSAALIGFRLRFPAAPEHFSTSPLL